MSDLKTINYRKADGTESERTIIETFVPRNISAIDVSELSDEDARKLLSIVEEHSQYVDQRRKMILGLADWIEQSGIDFDVSKIAHKKFKADGVTYLD